MKTTILIVTGTSQGVSTSIVLVEKHVTTYEEAVAAMRKENFYVPNAAQIQVDGVWLHPEPRVSLASKFSMIGGHAFNLLQDFTMTPMWHRHG